MLAFLPYCRHRSSRRPREASHAGLCGRQEPWLGRNGDVVACVTHVLRNVFKHREALAYYICGQRARERKGASEQASERAGERASE
eukprot:COSAG03_NODE_1144_length_4727_cov_528.735091_3_plen_86_part_00